MRSVCLLLLLAGPAGAAPFVVHGGISTVAPAAAASTNASSNTAASPASSSAASVTPANPMNSTPPPPFQPAPGLQTVPTISPLTQDLRPAVGLTPAQVGDLQTRLQAGGFYHGPIDGQLSGATRSSILSFQETARLPATGQIDAATAALLGVATPAAAAATFGTPFPLSSTGQTSVFVQP